MEENKNFRCGFVALVGRPNVGKSTLVNALLSQKVSIVSSVPQTTRYMVRAVMNLPDAQIIFVDTPGLHMFRDHLARQLNNVAVAAAEEVELILYVVDVTRAPAREESRVMDYVIAQKRPVIMALNKIDMGKKFVNEYIDMWRDKLKAKGVGDPVVYYIPISALQGKNLGVLVAAIKENLPFNPPFYEEGVVTDMPLKFRVADIVREKIFVKLKEELPHSVAVEVMGIEDKDKLVYISINVYVNRSSQKAIVIGKKGEMLKEIGTLSRQEIEQILGKKVYLDIRVKVLPDWQRRPRILKELGYKTD